MSDPRVAHPSADELAQFVSGLLAQDRSETIETHLAACDTCRTVLEGLPDDSLVGALRASTALVQALALTGPPAGPPVPAELAEAPNVPPAEAGGPPAGPPVPAELADHPRYQALELIGAGGMGTVYKAEHRLMKRLVALKVINKELMDNPAAVERFSREVQAAARLSHPNIVTAHDADQIGDTHFLVMEFVEGTSLDHVVKQQGPLAVAAACDYVREAARGLQHAFERGMVHRDIKPQNLMLTSASLSSGGRGAEGEEGMVKVLDFGLARFVSESGPAGPVTHSGVVMGTPDYIAPEQANDAHTADIRADIYSLGCTLYFLLTGQTPFPGGTYMEKLIAHREREPRPLAQLRPDLPAGVVRVVEKMMAKEPARRYQAPKEVAEALAPFAARAPEAATVDIRILEAVDDDQTRSYSARPVRPQTKPRPLSQRRGPLVTASLLFFTALLLAGGIVYRIQTDFGELIITSESPDVEVTISPGGKKVEIKDPNRKETIHVRTGEWGLEVKGKTEGLRLSQDKVTILRGKSEPVTVRHIPKEAPPPQPVAVQPPAREQVGQIRRLGEETDRFFNHAFSPDGRRAVSAGYDGTLRLWDIASGKAVRTLRGHTGDGFIRALAVSVDGRFALSGGSADYTVRLWNLDTGEEVHRLTGHTGAVFGVAFSPDGRRGLSGSQDKTLVLWDLEKGKEIRAFKGNPESIHAVAFSPDGRRALSGNVGPWSGGNNWWPPPTDNALRLWDVETGKEIRRFVGDNLATRSVAFSPDGRYALSGSDGGGRNLLLWDVETGSVLRPLPGHGYGVHAVAFSPDGRRALSGGHDGAIRLWDVTSGGELYCSSATLGSVMSVAFAGDGRYALSGSLNQTIRVWRLPDTPPAKVGEIRRLAGHIAGAKCVVFSPDGRRAYSGSWDHTIRFWDIETGQELRCLRGHTAPVLSLAVTSDGRYLLSSGHDESVRVWDTATGKQLRQLEGKHGSWSLAIAPENRLAVSGNQGVSWDIETGKRLQHGFIPGGSLGAAFSPDGKHLVSGGQDGNVSYWEVQTGRLIQRCEGHRAWIRSVAVTPDGRYALSSSGNSGGIDPVAGDDCTVRVWELKTGIQQHCLLGHTNTVWCVVVSRDGRRALSGSVDRTVRLWDLTTGKELQRFEAPSALWDVAISPDGRYGLSAGWDGVVRLWQLPDPTEEAGN